MPPRNVVRSRNEELPKNELEGNEVGRGIPPPPPPPSLPRERRIEVMVLEQNPPVFNGMGDPATAKTWIRSLERIFNFLGCTNQERLNCATFLLTGSADYWWEARTKTMTPEQLAQLTWEDFKTSIHDKYIPKSYRKAEEIEFYNLKQGRMSVVEYDCMFCDMSQYAPDQVDTDEKKAKKFCVGLNHEIRMLLASHGGLSYRESLRRALDIEAVMDEERSVVNSAPTLPPQQHNFRKKRKWDGDQILNEHNKQQTARNYPHDGGRQDVHNHRGGYRPNTPLCAKCSKNHFGECKAGTDECYHCGRSGHFSRECPNKNAGMGGRLNYQGSRLQLQAL